jgi:sugar-specific transcriptional regulator TrmB
MVTTPVVYKMNETLINNLKYLGFNVYEAKVYIELLKQTRPLTAYEIAGISGVPRSKVYEVVDKLFVKHALVQTENSPKKYLAVDPEVILKTIKSEFDSSLEYVKNEFSKLGTGETVDHILNLIGKEPVIKKSVEMITGASESILIATGPNMLSELDGCLHDAEDRGVVLNIVYYSDEKIAFKNVYYHLLNQPDIKNWLNILLDVDFREVLAGTMSVDSDEGHGICTKNVYMNNILQDNIVHEIYLGILEEKLGIEYIQEITERIPDRLWGRAMKIFKDYFRL